MATQNPWGNIPGTNIPYQEDPSSDYEKRKNDYRAWVLGQDRNAPKYSGLTEGSGNLSRAFTLYGQPDVNFTSNLAGLESRLGQSDDVLANLKARGMGAGRSPWAELLLQKQALEQQNASDRAGRLANTAQAAAFSNLASRGGLSAGARARLAKQGARDLMGSRQDVIRQGISDRLGIETTDEGQKLDILKSLPGMFNQKASIWGQLADSEAGRKQNLDLANRSYKTDIDRANIDTLIKDRYGSNAYELERWKTNMNAFGNLMQADAQENAGKK